MFSIKHVYCAGKHTRKCFYYSINSNYLNQIYSTIYSIILLICRYVSKYQSRSCAECGRISAPSDYQKIYLNFTGKESSSALEFKEKAAKLRSLVKQLKELEGIFDNQVHEQPKANGNRESNETYFNKIKTVLSQCQGRRYVIVKTSH